MLYMCSVLYTSRWSYHSFFLCLSFALLLLFKLPIPSTHALSLSRSNLFIYFRSHINSFFFTLFSQCEWAYCFLVYFRNWHRWIFQISMHVCEYVCNVWCVIRWVEVLIFLYIWAFDDARVFLCTVLCIWIADTFPTISNWSWLSRWKKPIDRSYKHTHWN